MHAVVAAAGQGIEPITYLKSLVNLAGKTTVIRCKHTMITIDSDYRLVVRLAYTWAHNYTVKCDALSTCACGQANQRRL